MFVDISFADVLFVLLVGGIIYLFVYWFGPARKGRLASDDETHRLDTQD